MDSALQTLVAQIADEIVSRMNGDFAPAAQASSCACQHPAAPKPSAPEVGPSPAEPADPSLAALIDHTLLKPDATRDDIVRLCGEARQFGFASVCVNPYWAALAARELRGTPVRVCTVVGFPLGANTTEAKIRETELAVRVGAQEIDMVLNIGALRSGDLDAVKLDIEAVVREAHAGGAIVKVILETALLDDGQKAVACALAVLAGADFVKTSTGFGPGGATVEDVRLMRRAVGPGKGVKASGGIQTRDDLRRMREAGANRIGASRSVQILAGGAR